MSHLLVCLLLIVSYTHYNFNITTYAIFRLTMQTDVHIEFLTDFQFSLNPWGIFLSTWLNQKGWLNVKTCREYFTPAVQF